MCVCVCVFVRVKRVSFAFPKRRDGTTYARERKKAEKAKGCAPHQAAGSLLGAQLPHPLHLSPFFSFSSSHLPSGGRCRICVVCVTYTLGSWLCVPDFNMCVCCGRLRFGVVCVRRVRLRAVWKLGGVVAMPYELGGEKRGRFSSLLQGETWTLRSSQTNRDPLSDGCFLTLARGRERIPALCSLLPDSRKPGLPASQTPNSPSSGC